ncbi:MAG: DUF370 domain-containing protein [Oscillospiraceae bacterium]|jgi:hypothetical protein|nr:DUF370 domain-containing protein [Oscillospiraceae bacterium]
MYLHIGGEYTLPAREIVGLFDLDGTTRGRGTRDFLARREKEGKLTGGSVLPRSFVLTANDRVYLSPITTATLKSRLFPGAFQ